MHEQIGSIASADDHRVVSALFRHSRTPRSSPDDSGNKSDENSSRRTAHSSYDIDAGHHRKIKRRARQSVHNIGEHRCCNERAHVSQRSILPHNPVKPEQNMEQYVYNTKHESSKPKAAPLNLRSNSFKRKLVSYEKRDKHCKINYYYIGNRKHSHQ